VTTTARAVGSHTDPSSAAGTTVQCSSDRADAPGTRVTVDGAG
jgi:hypothetical protein